MWIHKINPSILNDIYKGTSGNYMQKYRVSIVWQLNGKCYSKYEL